MRGLRAIQGAIIDERWCVDHLLGRRISDARVEIEKKTGIALDLKKFVEDFGRIMDAEMYQNLKATLHAADALKELEDRGLLMAVGSSGSKDLTIKKLEVTGLMKFFSEKCIFSGMQVERGKPAPDLFLLVARSMAVDPSACYVVEDSPYGVQAGKDAGMRVVGYVGGSHLEGFRNAHAKKLWEAGADAVITDHSELMAALNANS